MNGAIELITGTLGGGKTLFSVERMYEHIKAGGYAFTNVEVHHDKFRDMLAEEGLRFDPARLVVLDGDPRLYHTKIQRGTADSVVMLVVDEAGLSQNSRDWAKTDKAELAFNTLARKLDILLLYVTQDANDIDKQFRRKAGKIWVCRNLKHYKLLGVLPFPIPLMFRVCMDNTSGKPKREHTDVSMRRSWACGLYNTDAMHGTAADQFRGMGAVKATPLERLRPEERPKKKSIIPEMVTTLCAAFSYAFFAP